MPLPLFDWLSGFISLPCPHGIPTWEACPLPAYLHLVPRSRPRAHACTFSFQFFIVLLVILLAELILIILFFVYMDKVRLPGGEGVCGVSLPVGLGQGIWRKSTDRLYL